MKACFLAASLAIASLSTLFCGAVRADALAGFSDITVVSDAIVSLRYEGTEYVVANDDLMLGTTTRWYIPTATGVPTQWVDGTPAPAATTTAGAPPKPEDPGSEGDNFYFRRNGQNDMSSVDAINFQETVFPVPTDTIFVFERGGNDTGTFQAILLDGSLGAKVPFSGASVYKDTGVDVAGQHAFGVVFTTTVRVKGVRIDAPGHDCLTICAIPKRADPKQSQNPQPPDVATDVLREAILAWTAGEGATTHDVYLGTSFEAVDGASRTDPRGVLISQGQAAETYDPAALTYGQTYYWRVDEVSAGAAIFKGAVWSFTIEPYAYPIRGVTATASSAQVGAGPENTVNGSGLNADDQHGVELKQMWLSTGVLPNWVQFQFDKAYELHELWVWNSNQLIETFVGFGAKNVTIEYSLDGSAWKPVAGVPEFARGTGSDTYVHNTTVALRGTVAKYVKFTIDSTWGGVPQCSLSEVRFFYVPVQARAPVPNDAAKDVDLDPTLAWRAGRAAASHKVYLGQDKDAVAKGTAPATAVTEPSFTPATLSFGTTYYWRVDEVNEARTPGISEGTVWSFTTKAYEVVDDFESYTDDEGNRIYETWIDGFGTTNNGSQVGYTQAPFAERALVHGGRQSMPLSYSNTGGFSLSEAERTFAAAQDWTRGGVTTLTVYFRGDPNNTTGKLYLKVNGVKVAYNGDAAALKAVTWTQWNVALASVNTNLKKVTRLALGVDSGGQGILYVDDLRLLPAAAAPALKLTIAPAGTIKATGNDGTVQSINGIDAAKLVLGKTVADYEKYPDHPAAHADDLNLGTYASLDEAKTITTMFAGPVTTIFVIERGGNDSGFIQPLDAAGQLLGEPQPFVTASWSKPGVTIGGQAAGGLAITSSAPIRGIKFLPPAGGVTGVDPASIAGVPAQ
ncbi:MAG: discoidin domain-containing protein [Planctomycetes bacterium]|jgi:hypothetical protein|nr:discoidin domain-containing protein [Planctomycetota bacterium]